MDFSSANGQCETELIKQIRQGAHSAILPETLDDLENLISIMSAKKSNIPRILLNGFLQLRLGLLEEHKKGNFSIAEATEKHGIITSFITVLESLFEYDYPNLEHRYEVLRDLTTPTLILWGRQDKV